MSWRRLHALVSRLPPESALAAAQAGGWERARYTTTDEVAAQTHELVQLTNRVLGEAHLTDRKKGHDNPVAEPSAAPRPFDTD